MSKEYEGQDPMAIARQAERELNSHQAKHGVSTADSGKHLPPSPQLTTQLIPPSHRIRRRHQRHQQVPGQHHQSRLRRIRRR